MGDEMDAMIPEREMKVRARPGPPRLRESWSCLGAPPLPAAPPARRLQIARLSSVRSSVRVAGVSSLQVQVTCPGVALTTPSELPQALSCAGRLMGSTDSCLLSERYCSHRRCSPYNQPRRRSKLKF